MRNGLTLAQVEALLGPAISASSSREGSLEVRSRQYRSDNQVIEAKFVGGVLVDYTVHPAR